MKNLAIRKVARGIRATKLRIMHRFINTEFEQLEGNEIMAQMLVINSQFAKRKVDKKLFKTEADVNAFQPVDDIVDTFEDDKPISSTLYFYDVIHVEGLTKRELDNALPQIRYQENELSGAMFWKEKTDLTWKVLGKEPKQKLSVKSLAVKDKQNLASNLVSKEAKVLILNRVANKIKDYPENLVEI